MKLSLFLIVIFLYLKESIGSQQGNKVLIYCMPGGSHLMFMKDLAYELVHHNYNVTMFLIKEQKEVEELKKLGVNMIFYPNLKAEDLDSMNERLAKGEGALEDLFHISSLPFYPTTTHPDWIPSIKRQEFDLMIRDFFPNQNSLAHILDIPKNIMMSAGPIEGVLLKKSVGAPAHSTIISMFEEAAFVGTPNDVQDQLDRSSFMARFKSMLASFPSQLLFSYLIDRHTTKIVADEYKHLMGREPKSDLVLSIGVEGILEQNSVPPHVKTVYPLSKSKDLSPKPIPEEIIKYLDTHEKVMLIAFGSTYRPHRYFLEMVEQFSKQNNKYGIVMALKRMEVYGDIYDRIQQDNIVLVTDWIPQRELLSSGRVTVFYTHGGFNSVMESFEGGVPMIVTPLEPNDQHTNCKRILQSGYGYCLEKPTFEAFTKAVKEFEKNNYFKENMAHVKKVVGLKKQDPHDLVYWVRQVLEVGTEHLVPRDTVNLSFIQLQDIDIHFAFFSLVLVVLLAVVFLLKTILKACCGSKQLKEKKE